MYFSDLSKQFEQHKTTTMLMTLAENVRDISEDSEIESCGFFWSDGSIKACNNIHDKPTNYWSISDKDFYLHYLAQESEHKPVGVYHTHVTDLDGSKLTLQDLASLEAYDLQSFCWHTKNLNFDYYDPNFIHPYPAFYNAVSPKLLDFYTGWSYQWGRCDCFSIIRSFYAGFYGIVLDPFKRAKNKNGFLKDGWNLIQDNVLKQGFQQLSIDSEIKPGYLLTFAITSPTVHHLAVAVEGNKILHLNNMGAIKQSKVEPLNDYWRSFLRGIYVHKELA